MGQNSFRGRILVTHCIQPRGKNFVISVNSCISPAHDNMAKYFKKEIPSDFKGLYLS